MKKLIAIIGTCMMIIAFFRVINGAETISVTNVLIYLQESEKITLDVSIYDQLKIFDSLSGKFSWSDEISLIQNIKNAVMYAFDAVTIFFTFIGSISTVFIGNLLAGALAVLKLIWYLFGFGG